jgi:hypothetical protein
MEHDFMTGPFINYYTLNKPTNRSNMLDGFVFSPSRHKKIQIHLVKALIVILEQKIKRMYFCLKVYPFSRNEYKYLYRHNFYCISTY